LQRKVTCLWKEPGAAQQYRTGVSLHSHTNHSKEGLYFIAEYAARHWPLRKALASQEKKAQHKSAITVDFWKGYWTPPLPPLAAFALEKNQIEQSLGLQSMVSISDHDNIEAPMLLRVVPEARRVPVSVEWTAPFQDATFHLGVHNLPASRAESIMADLAEYTRCPKDERFPALLSGLHQIPELLVVLNHPLWNLGGIPQERHEAALRTLLCKAGQFIHALELNGMRGWQENQSVLHLSQACNQQVISGGDRHGCEPNAILNLTNAESFTEFVYQIRRERFSHVLVMPQYGDPYVLRILQGLLDATREYPSIGSRSWDERVFHPDRSGVIRPLSELWDNPPFYIRYFFSFVRLLEMAPVRNVLLAFAKPQEQVRFALGETQEVAP
jgi:hypothetical protein